MPFESGGGVERMPSAWTPTYANTCLPPSLFTSTPISVGGHWSPIPSALHFFQSSDDPPHVRIRFTDKRWGRVRKIEAHPCWVACKSTWMYHKSNISIFVTLWLCFGFSCVLYFNSFCWFCCLFLLFFVLFNRVLTHHTNLITCEPSVICDTFWHHEMF